jgi:lipoate-protein ligase A
VFPCRLLIDRPASGAWNMAVDEVLLESAARDGLMTLRFYRWSEPTLSLGYFQRFADREQHPASAQCPIVRRSSGGGAIVHDQELTYSLTVPIDLPISLDPLVLYDAAHDSLVEAFGSWGIRVRKFIDSEAGSCGKPPSPVGAVRNEPFLCFQRRTCGDVLLDRWKVCGSAQRRHRGAILQHGSVLLTASAAAPELPGVQEVSGVTLHEIELVHAWKSRFASHLSARALADELTPSELSAARELTLAKHAAESWIKKK